jgi:hypothetical protein
MDNERFQKDNPLLFWFFIIAGILLIISSFLLRSWGIDSIWIDVLLNVGASLIATAGIAYLYQRFGTNSLSYYLDQLLRNFSITQRTIELGILDMWRERRHIPNDMWNSFTEKASSEVWLLGMAELGFAEDPRFHKIVAEGAKRGCKFRFLLLDPDSDVVSVVDSREGGGDQLQGRIKRSVNQFRLLQVQNLRAKGKVEIRVHSNVPQVSIIRSDDEFLITPYMFFRPGNSSFTFRLRKTPKGISDHYEKFFEQLWSEAYPPTENSHPDQQIER